jgi:CTP:molybdopterin cytidylyltransferase MocA
LDGIVMALADQPLIEAADVQQLTQAYAQRSTGIEMVFPKVNGAPGNPVMLSAAARTAILAQDRDFGCKEWRQAHKPQVQPFDSSNLHFTTDLDHLEDVTAFTSRTGRTLRWPDPWVPD